MVYLARSPRLPDACFYFSNLRARSLSLPSGCPINWVHRHLTDSTRTIVNAYAYTPFGTIANQQESVVQPFKFVGQYGVMVEDNGWYYMRARYYDPAVGRFISEDPLGFDGGDVNLYAYAQNDPVNMVDQWGLQSSYGLPGYNASYGNPYYTSLGASMMTTGRGGTPPDVNVTVGGTVSVLTKDYTWNIDVGGSTGRSSSLLGMSVDVTIGEKGNAEVGAGARNIGVGVNLGENGLEGMTMHWGMSFPPTFGFGSVSDSGSQCK